MTTLVTSKDYPIITAARTIVAPWASPAIPTEEEVASGLSSAGLRVLQSMLSCGCLQQLMDRGGWRKGATVTSAGIARRGRLWERFPELPPLRFTGASIELCRWLAAGAQEALAPPAQPAGLGSGDEMLIYLACNSPRSNAALDRILTAPLVRSSGLAWLSHAADFSLAQAPVPTTPAFTQLVQGTKALIVELLTHDLAKRWISMERGKATARVHDRLRNLGATQAIVLERFLDSVELAKRWDLATFLVDTIEDLIVGPEQPRDIAARFRGQLGSEGTVAERQAAVRASAATLRCAQRLLRWYDELRHVRNFEDHYGAAQVVVRRWERVGRAGFTKAEAVVQELDSIDAAIGA